MCACSGGMQRGGYTPLSTPCARTAPTTTMELNVEPTNHPSNRLSAETGNRKMGGTRALYDTTFSERGVMVGASRAPRKPSPFDFQPQLLIRTPALRAEELSKWVRCCACISVLATAWNACATSSKHTTAAAA